jgi:hypothetical protein
MSNFTGLLTGFASGDDLDVTRTVPSVPATQTLTKAWLTIKTKVSDADPGLLQKAVTSSLVSGVGQITDTGASGTGSLLFQLTGADTLALPVGTLVYYDIKVKTSASKIYTIEQGKYISTARITTATS